MRGSNSRFGSQLNKHLSSGPLWAYNLSLQSSTMAFDEEEQLELCLELSERIASVLAPSIGIYEDREFSPGATGDVTYEVDEGVEQAVIDYFTEHRLLARVMTEDQGTVEFGQGPRPTYLIDPLDGSRNARRGLPFFCFSIAVFPPGATRLSDVRVSLIKRLDVDETFYATSKGAFLDGQPISVSAKENLRDAILCLCSHFTLAYPAHAKQMQALSELSHSPAQDVMIKCLGSTALELAFLACGRVDILMDLRQANGCEMTPKTYDIAAGAHIARQAGATVQYGEQSLPQDLPIDPKIPVQVIGAASEPLFMLVHNCI